MSPRRYIITLVCFVALTPLEVVRADTLICERARYSTNELVVKVPEQSYETFVELIESGAVVPGPSPLAYGGGVETDGSKYWSLKSGDYTIGLQVDYHKTSREFVFWVQTCGTRESWRPYWRALVARAQEFPDAKVSQRPLRDD